jgi:CBS domain containing-hemolysin-like protein
LILLAVALALLVSAIFSGAETVLLSVHRFRLAERSLRSRQESRWAGRVAGDPSKTLATILVGNSLANIFLASLVTLWATHRWGEPVIWIVVPTVTLLILIFGEILPKSLARAHAEGLRRRLLPLVGFAYAILRPWVALVSGATIGLLRALRITGKERKLDLTRQDLQVAMAESEEYGRLNPLQGRILRQALDFADTPIEAAMIPRTKMIAVELGTKLDEALRLMQEHRFSRLPVYRDDLDQVVGVVHRLDLFRAPSRDLVVDGLVRPVHLVPHSKHSHELLRELQARRQHMAIVLDEYGGTAGLVTVEDLLEELVGEIRQEDEPEVILRRLDAFTVAIPGTAGLDELRDATGLTLPEGDYETVAGFMLDRLGRVPKPREAVTVGKHRLEVLSGTERRIDQIAVRRERAERRTKAD